MNPDWQHFVLRLNSHPPGIHRLLAPCSGARLQVVQDELGKMPDSLVEMLAHFNGAELFIRNAPFVSIFGVSAIPPMSHLEWAADWYIDKFTPLWRSTINAGEDDWAIAMMNYGGLIILQRDGTTREWDTSQNAWAPRNWAFSAWLEELLREGDIFMNE